MKPSRNLVVLSALAIGAVAAISAVLLLANRSSLRSVGWDGLIAEGIGLTGWKGDTRRGLRRKLGADIPGFEAAAESNAVEHAGLKIERGYDYVDFRDGLCALRYFPRGTGTITENKEILRADQLNIRWWVYESDWN